MEDEIYKQRHAYSFGWEFTKPAGLLFLFSEFASEIFLAILALLMAHLKCQ